MIITLVAAVGRNGVIGRAGGLPWEPTGDLVHFKRVTMGHTLLMGRRTYESIGRPLPGRTTVVVTRRPDWHVEGVRVARSLGEAFSLVGGEHVFVVGGGEVYARTMQVADRLLVTEVDQAPEGDTFFPAIDPTVWHERDRESYEGFDIVTYERC